jgi:LacI family transcriptional regulator
VNTQSYCQTIHQIISIKVFMEKKTQQQTSPGAKTSSGRSGAPVTLEMVAQLAGVSPSTVSRILNSTATVSEVKRQAVDDAIARLGFVPNPVARGLAGGRTFSIGVVTHAIDSPFYGASLRGIEDELDPAGYSPLFVSAHWNAISEARCIEVLRSRRVDGIIVLTGRLSDQALKAYAKTQPVVVTGRTLKAPGLFAFNFDNFEGGLLATRHLIALGHNRIVFIAGNPDHPDANERFRGYRTALEQSKIAYDPSLVITGDYSEGSGAKVTEQLIAAGRHFTAIFAANDQMAFGAALGLHRRSLRVPQDVSLVGFDDLPMSQYCIPPLTTVHQSAYELGRLAGSAMLQMLNGMQPKLEGPLPRLIVRHSCQPTSS